MPTDKHDADEHRQQVVERSSDLCMRAALAVIQTAVECPHCVAAGVIDTGGSIIVSAAVGAVRMGHITKEEATDWIKKSCHDIESTFAKAISSPEFQHQQPMGRSH